VVYQKFSRRRFLEISLISAGVVVAQSFRLKAKNIILSETAYDLLICLDAFDTKSGLDNPLTN
jgi:hypothetical protein